MFNSKAKFILASTSFIRRKMLAEQKLDAKCIDSGIDETKIKLLHSHSSGADLALILSDEKAQVISKKNSNTYVISADQIAVYNGQHLSKTSNLSECIEQLKLLEGGSHHLFTATSLFYNGNCIWHTVANATLKMKSLTINQIQDYVKLDKPLNSVGAYYYEANGASLFSKVKGQVETILGFECQELVKHLVLNNII